MVLWAAFSLFESPCAEEEAGAAVEPSEAAQAAQQCRMQWLSQIMGSDTRCRKIIGMSLGCLDELLRAVVPSVEAELPTATLRSLTFGMVRKAILARILFWKGSSLEVSAALAAVGSTSVSRLAEPVDASLFDFAARSIPGGPSEEGRDDARAAFSTCFPGCVGFVDGATFPIRRPQDDAVRGHTYTSHHGMYGVNYLVFVSVRGRILELYEMGPGGFLSERRAAQSAVADMRSKGLLGSDEYFVGDAIYAGMFDGIHGLQVQTRMTQLAAHMLPIASTLGSLDERRRRVLRGATAHLVVEALMLRVLTPPRNVVENSIEHMKSFSSRMFPSGHNVNFTAARRAALHTSVVISAGLTAWRAQHSPMHSLPRQNGSLAPVSFSVSPVGCLLASVHVIGGHKRARDRNTFIDKLHYKYKRRRDLRAVQQLAELVYPVDREDHYGEAASRLREVMVDYRSLIEVPEGILSGGLPWLRGQLVERKPAGFDASMGSSAPSRGAAAGESSQPAKQAASRKGRSRRFLQQARTWLQQHGDQRHANREIIAGSIWSPVEGLCDPTEAGYYLVLEPSRMPDDLAKDPAAWTAWWYEQDGSQALAEVSVDESAEELGDEEPNPTQMVRVHEFTTIDKVERTHFEDCNELLSETEIQATFSQECALMVMSAWCAGHDYSQTEDDAPQVEAAPPSPAADRVGLS